MNLQTAVHPSLPAFLFAVAGVFAFPSASVAQTPVPPPFDAGRAVQETRPVPPPPPSTPPDPVIDQLEDRSLALPEGERLTVNAFRFEGAEFVPEAELQAAVAPYRGKSLTMVEIEEAAGRVTALYRSRGFPVARAWVPRQDASGGTLTIQVIVGKYGKVSVQNQSLVCDAKIKKYFDRFSDGRPVVTRELEHTMLLLNELPGATMPRVSIAPGEEPGTSDFVAEVDAGKRYSGYALVDNYGTDYTGKHRLSLGATANSPLKMGDRLDVSGMVTEDTGLLSGRLAYSLPLGSRGLRAELALARTTYELGDEYKALDATGRADSVEANVSYPFIRSRTQSLTGTVGLVGRDLKDEIDAFDDETRKRAVAATVGASYDRYGTLFGRNVSGNVSGGVTWGRLSFRDSEDEAANKAGADTAGSYGRANISLSGRLALTDKITASTSLSVQRALNRNLDSSEQFIVSGTRGVMAYETALSGDHGTLFNVELRHALPGFYGIRHSVGAFFNAARVSYYDGDYTTNDKSSLQDAGLNYVLTWRELYLRGQVSRALGSWPDAAPKDDKTRFLFQCGLLF